MNTSFEVLLLFLYMDHHILLCAQFLIILHLIYPGGAARPCELCHSFSLSNDLTQMVNCSTRIPGCYCHSPAFLDWFISPDPSISSVLPVPPLRNSAHVVVSISIDFPSNPKGDALCHITDNDYSHPDWVDLLNHQRNVFFGGYLWNQCFYFYCCDWIL